MSDPLIDRLTADLRATPRLAVARRLAVGVGAGAAASAALTYLTLGFRPDMAQAVSEGAFWMKLAYVLGLGGVALWSCERLARPGPQAESQAGRRLPWLLAPLAAVALLAGWQLLRAPAPMRMPMVMGASSASCPWSIAVCAVPPLAGLVWAVRGLAPTRLRLTGLVLGLAAGGVGAAAYSLHCPESTAPFLAVWYTVGIAAAAAAGGLAGPRLLRW